jgi:uncharacterized protein (DUF58 family)
VSRRPSRQAFAFLGVGGLLVGVGSTAQAGWLFVLAAFVLGAVAASALLAPRLGACAVDRSLPRRVSVGDLVPVRLLVANGGRAAVAALRLQDDCPGLEPAAAHCDLLPPGQSAETRQARRALQRGLHTSGRVVLSSAWPFGVVRTRRALEVRSPFVVLPRWVELGSFPLLDSFAAPEQSHASARVGHGDQFVGVREYRAGDDSRRVHWRATARAGRLVVREHEEPAGRRVALVFAGGEHGIPPDSAFEALVSAVASIAVHALRAARAVELLRAEPGGRRERLEATGVAHALDWLARARPEDIPLQPLVADAMRTLGRGGSVVLFAPNTGRSGADLVPASRMVEAHGCSCALVTVDARQWDPDVSVSAPGAGGRRGRVVTRTEDLGRCLQG